MMKKYTPAILRETLIYLKDSIENDERSLVLLKKTPVKAKMSMKLLKIKIEKKKVEIKGVEELLKA